MKERLNIIIQIININKYILLKQVNTYEHNHYIGIKMFKF